MTCRCRYQFCYVCAAQWKTCGCPQWEERRLLAAAEQRVERQLPPRGVNGPEQGLLRRLVQQEAERLRTNHDCAHTSWRTRFGPGRCESCHFHLDRFLLVSSLHPYASHDMLTIPSSVVWVVRCWLAYAAGGIVCERSANESHSCTIKRVTNPSIAVS